MWVVGLSCDETGVTPTCMIHRAYLRERATRSQEFDLDPANTDREVGIWSDGDTVWVVSWDDGIGPDKLYAYYLPGGSSDPRVTAVSAESTGRTTATATARLLNPGLSATVNLRYKLTTDINWTNATAQATAGIIGNLRPDRADAQRHVRP